MYKLVTFIKSWSKLFVLKIYCETFLLQMFVESRHTGQWRRKCSLLLNSCLLNVHSVFQGDYKFTFRRLSLISAMNISINFSM